ncbi:MAG: hypothetical protein QOD71_1008 [Thermoleophilaceae bacterium]|jgi:hypothetical protein|nr:hypothetical protein [Thermoleophilaceae bacterium]
MARLQKVQILKAGRFTPLHRTVGAKFSVQMVEPLGDVVMRRVRGVVPSPFAHTDFLFARRANTIPTGAISAASLSGAEIQATYHVFTGADYIEVPEAPTLQFQTTFSGNATLRTTHPDAPSFTVTFSIGLGFFDGLTQVLVVSFAPIVAGPFDTPLGANLVTVTNKGAGPGSFDAATGAISVPVKLKFDHSVVLIGDSDLALTLTTGSAEGVDGATITGSPLDSTSSGLTLVGSGTFDGGQLGNHAGDLVAVGTLDALP